VLVIRQDQEAAFVEYLQMGPGPLIRNRIADATTCRRCRFCRQCRQLAVFRNSSA